MSVPILTTAEKNQLQKEVARQQNFSESLLAQIPAKQARAAELAVVDGAFKKFFDYYNDDIISKYDIEYKALNGRFIIDPITEADVEGPANIDGSVRTTPSLPVTDIIRVVEFDGGGTSIDSVNESQHILDQADIEDTLVNGYPSSGGFDDSTANTNSSLDSGSTTLDITDSTNPLTISIGDVFVVENGVDLAVVEVTSVTDNMGGDPPYDFTYGISFIVPPSGTISIGASIKEFLGFPNSERATKTASDPALQPLMIYLIDLLEMQINNRIDRLDEQLIALNANGDPDAISEIALTVVLVSNSKTFLENYLLTTDISDSGLLSLSSERASRDIEITDRISQISNNYTNQTENYYDRRYQIANDRGNTSRGSLRLQKATEASLTTLQEYSDSAQDAVDAINALLA